MSLCDKLTGVLPESGESTTQATPYSIFWYNRNNHSNALYLSCQQNPTKTSDYHPKPQEIQPQFLTFSSRKRQERATQTTSIHHFLRPQEPTTKQTFNHLKKTRPTTKRHHPSTQKTIEQTNPIVYFPLIVATSDFDEELEAQIWPKKTYLR
uniref:Uncharacterized protein n=1 Tax=Solanum tuberosum TaxID=4113 RepID=M1D9D0_SOLTU